MGYNFDKKFEIRDVRNGNWFWSNQSILEDKRLTPSDKNVYFGLTCYVNQAKKDQVVFPTVNTIAKRIKLSPRQVRYSQNKLSKLGYIKMVRKSGKRNSYILLKVTPAKSAPLKKSTLTPAKSAVTPANGTHDLASNKNVLTRINNKRGLKRLGKKMQGLGLT